MSRLNPAKIALLLSPVLATPAFAAAPGTQTVVYTFGAATGSVDPASGCFPYSGLLSAKGGSVFYGTTSQCGLLADGSNAGGTLYEITRGSGTAAAFTVLHAFNPTTEGSYPANVPVTDGKSLFGAATFGGPNNQGTIYQWVPPAAGQPSGTLTVLYAFTDQDDGGWPTGGLFRAANGVLYGTTSHGAAQNDGVVFSLTPPAAGQTAWTYRVIHTFTGADGGMPQAGVIADAAGNLYGTTEIGGSAGHGTVFELTPPTVPGGAWSETTLTDFLGATAPSSPIAPLIFDAHGNLYGTSNIGGASNDGTVFELSPPAAGGTTWTSTVLLTFTGLNGREPAAPLLLAPNGTLYGTTEIGGSHNTGTAFSLAPPPAGSTTWQPTVLLNFQGGPAPKGAYPYAGFDFVTNGQLISTTSVRGTTNSGVIFLLQP